MEALNAKLEKLSREHEKHELWFQQLRQALAGMTTIVARVERASEREMAQREAGQTLLDRLLERHQENLARLNTLTLRHRVIINLVFWLGGGAVMVAVGAVLTYRIA